MSSHLTWCQPEEAGLDPLALVQLDDWLHGFVDRGDFPSVAWCGGRFGRMLAPRFFGRARRDRPDPPDSRTRFLVASITKPIVVAGAMKLVESGRITLDDPLVGIIPGFDSGDRARRSVTVRHLMTHTSGLPDQLPTNEALRQAHAPLSAFIEATCRHPLLFPPGTRVRYQSMGTLMLSAVIEAIAGRPISEFLDREIFRPLGMLDTQLGLTDPDLGRVAELRVAPDRVNADWNWNSDYWLRLGSPWGGLLTTPADLARFALAMLDEADCRAFSRATVRAMTRNQLEGFADLPEPDRRCRPWGLGWRLAWPGHSAHFGDLVGPRTFGHWGATGSVLWIDPDARGFFLLFTNAELDDESRVLARASNRFAASWRG